MKAPDLRRLLLRARRGDPIDNPDDRAALMRPGYARPCTQVTCGKVRHLPLTPKGEAFLAELARAAGSGARTTT